MWRRSDMDMEAVTDTTRKVIQFLCWPELDSGLLDLECADAVRSFVIDLQTQLKSCRDRLDESTPDINETAELFAPGHCLLGTIKIPSGDTDGEFGARVDYELEFRRRCIDVDGHPILLAIHAAHGDEQSCVFSSDTNSNGETSFMYGDFETQCTGSVVGATTSICGTVKQYQYGEEGYELPAKQEDHTFTLQLDETSTNKNPDVALERILKSRLAIALAYFFTIRMRDNLYPQNEDESETQLLDGTECYEELIRVFCEVNAMFLLHVDRIHNLDFKNEENRKEILDMYQSRGICRANAQKCWDAVSNLSMALFAPTFRVLKRKNLVEDAIILGEIQKLQHSTHALFNRVDRCYSRFDKALRNAENRMTDSVFEAMVYLPEGCVNYSEDSICCICFCAVVLSGSSPPVICTPCKHYFHVDCVKTWFHNNPSCPQCRSNIATQNDSSK